MKKKKLAAIFLAATMTATSAFGSMPAIAFAAEDTQVVNAKVDYMVNPVGLAKEDVKFSWAMTSSDTGAAQTAYQIVVCEGSADGAIVWDSGKVDGSESVGIPYGGNTALQDAARYYWTVTITDKDGNTAVSDPAYFETAGSIDGARWLYAGGANQAAPLFRKEMALDSSKTIVSARLYMTAMGIYQAYINGRQVNSNVDDIFNPGWTAYEHYANYQTYDVTDLVQNGNNAIGVAVGGGWYQTAYQSNFAAVFGPDDKASERGILGKLVVTYDDGTSTVVNTDTDWKVSQDSPYTYDDFWNGEHYDANIAAKISGWNEAGYQDSGWNAADVTEYSGELHPNSKAAAVIRDEYEQKPIAGYTYDPANILNATGTSEGLTYGEVVREDVNVDNDITIKAGDKLILDMGQNMVGLTNAVMSGSKDTEVTFRFAEALNDGRDSDYVSDDNNGPMGSDGPDGSLYRIALRSAQCTDIYTMTGEDKEEYQQTFTYRGFRYVEVSATKDITLHSLRGRVITSVSDRTGYITTSDSDLNRFVENTIWSEMGNYLSIPIDCPQRNERAGWTGDAQLFAQSATLNFDVNAFLENYIDIMNDYAENSNNFYADVMPKNRAVDSKYCGWSDAGIIIPWVMYQQTGDISFIENSYDQMDAYMAAGEYNTMLYGDWLAYCGTRLPVMNVVYEIYDCVLMEKMSQLTGRADKAEQYRGKYEELKESFIATYVDENYNLLTDNKDDFVLPFAKPKMSADNAQTGLLWALKLNLYTNDEMRDAFIKNLLINIENKDGKIRPGQDEDTLSVGFLGVNVILPILTDLGYGDVAYTLMLQDTDPSWLYAVKNGATTTWERWNSYSVKDGYGDSSMNSFNHYSYGASVEWMYNYMAGIKSDEANPGYKHFILQPTADPEGRIDFVNGSYDSMYGTIESLWTSDQGEMNSYTAVVPANTTATLYLNLDKNQVESLALPEGAVYAGRETRNGADCAKFELEAGSYSFEIQSKSNAAVIAAQEAQKAAEEARMAAEEARAAAEEAQTSAETAQKLAEEAQKKAENAVQTSGENSAAAALAKVAAEQAKKDAETAKGLAETAQTAAENAKTMAEDAQRAAEDAMNGSIDAQKKAEEARDAALQAKNTAVESKNAADKAVESAEAQVKLAEAAKDAAIAAKEDAVKAQAKAEEARKIAEAKAAEAEKALGEARQLKKEMENLLAKTKFEDVKATIKTASSSKKKQAKITWKRVKGADGYQIQYAVKSNFKGKKTLTVKGTRASVKTIKKLKSKKTYFVRIRAYKTIDGKKVYTNYSAKKQVKVK